MHPLSVSQPVGARAASCLPILALSALLIIGAALNLSLGVRARPGYTYYGYVPREIWDLRPLRMAGHDVAEWSIDSETVRSYAHLVAVGNVDGTRVAVYTLPGKEPIREFTLDKLEKVTVALPNGTFFKVVSDNPVTVVLMGGASMEAGEAFTNTFFTSTDGGYIGKEFIFMALEGKAYPYAYELGPPCRVYALEDSAVTIWDENGSKVSELNVLANQASELSLKALAPYRLVSTGNVMLQYFFMGSDIRVKAAGTFYYPAVQGGFLGKTFYGSGGRMEWGFINPQFVLTASRESKATFLDVDYKRKGLEATVPLASNLTVQPKASHLILESDNPVVFMLAGFNGLAYTGLKGGQTAYVYVPTAEPLRGEAYLFASQETTVTVDDVSTRLKADEALPLYSGLHKVSSSENAVIQVVNWPAPSELHYSYIGRVPDFVRLADFAACIPSVESMSISHEEVKLKPLLGGELPWTYIGAAIVLAAIVIAALTLRRRRRQ